MDMTWPCTNLGLCLRLPKVFLAAGIAACWLLLPQAAAGSDKLDSKGYYISVDVENEKVVMVTRIAGAFSMETKKAVSGGAPVVFTYIIQMKRKRWLLWDSTVSHVVLKKTVKYDALKKNYLLWEKKAENVDEDEIEFGAELAKVDYKDAARQAPEAKAAPAAPPKENKADERPPVVMDPLMVSSLKEMEDWMSSSGKLDLGPASGMDKDSEYYVQLRLKVRSLNSSPPQALLLSFTSFLDLDSGWIESEPFEAPSEKDGAATDKEQPKQAEGNSG